MKKLTAVLLILLMCISLCACSSSGNPEEWKNYIELTGGIDIEDYGFVKISDSEADKISAAFHADGWSDPVSADDETVLIPERAADYYIKLGDSELIRMSYDGEPYGNDDVLCGYAGDDGVYYWTSVDSEQGIEFYKLIQSVLEGKKRVHIEE